MSSSNLIVLIVKLAFKISIWFEEFIEYILESRERFISLSPSMSIFIFELSGITNDLMLILCGAMGFNNVTLDSGDTIEPPLLSEYPVDPVGVDMIKPSDQ